MSGASFRFACILFALLAARSAFAEDRPVPPELPATMQASAWIEQHPAVVEARHAATASDHAAAVIETGPHEWVARLSTQRRDVRDVGQSTEWSAQIERGVRVGGKAALDRQLAKVQRELAATSVGQARWEAAHELAQLWLDVVAAEQALALAREQLELAEANAQAVAKRKRAGDASVLDQHGAEVDRADAQRQASLAHALLTRARSKLRMNFPAAAVTAVPLPDPTEPHWIEAQWRDRVLVESDPLKIAQALHRKAELTAQRSEAERVSDPTIGLYASQEAFRSERVIGVSVSMPFGGARQDRARQAYSEAQVARLAYERQRREVEAAVTEAYAEAVGGLQRWRLAQAAASAARETARLMQRAYSLGEADLQALQQARRQSVEVSTAALQSRVDALRAHHRLLIDAHLIWDLEHD